MRFASAKSRRVAVSTCLFLLACTSSLAHAADVRFQGAVGFSNGTTFTLLNAEGIRNFASSGSSGPLRMELWATAAPFSGSLASGYQLATYALVPLAAAASFTGVSSGAVPYTPAPAGQCAPRWQAARTPVRAKTSAGERASAQGRRRDVAAGRRTVGVHHLGSSDGCEKGGSKIASASPLE